MKRFFLIASIFRLTACSNEPEATKTSAIHVEGERAILAETDKAAFLSVASVEPDQGGVLRLPGRLIWNEEKTVRIVPQVAGRVERIAVDIGDKVKINQALAVLNSADYGQALAERRKSQADLRVAQQALERNRQLREAGVIAEKDWQQIEATAIATYAEAERASKRLAGLGGEGGGSYVLRSPLAGVIVERNLNPGMEVRPDQATPPLFVLTDPTHLWIQIDASEADLPRLRKGGALLVESKQYPGETFKGVIRHVSDFVDPIKRTITIRGEIDNSDRRLKSEMFINVLLELPATQALRVPAAAVFLFGDKRYVFVEEAPGRYRRQLVQAGSERDGKIDLVAGVKVGDKVVTEGNLHLLKFFKAELTNQQATK